MSFAGCIQDVKYATTNTPDLVLEDIDLSAGLQTNNGVQLNGCYDKVAQCQYETICKHVFVVINLMSIRFTAEHNYFKLT